ncbi:uncharacterized protein J3R85_020423 [Psidium guajava]|nr:uncharacterized protein J3R85_020423 [Psidium guajava]
MISTKAQKSLKSTTQCINEVDKKSSRTTIAKIVPFNSSKKKEYVLASYGAARIR